jgi:glyoxylate reductase
MALIFVTRNIPEIGLRWMREGGHEVVVSKKDGVLTPEELRQALAARPYDGVVSLLTDTIDTSLLEIVPTLKIVANYAVGFNNIAVKELTEAGVVVTNTPGVLTATVAEFTVSLLVALAKRIPEADRFTKAGRYEGWAPQLLLGSDLYGKTVGILENEPALTVGLSELDNVIVTPHIASASEETRGKMSELVAITINEFFLGHTPPHVVSIQS